MDFDLDLPIKEWLDKEPELHEETLRERIMEKAVEIYERKEEIVGAEAMRNFEKGVMLQTLDTLWKEHLVSMDYLRQGIIYVVTRKKILNRSINASLSVCLLTC
ncbi:hypothetical protein MASR2M36_34160 [Providencia sp.]